MHQWIAYKPVEQPAVEVPATEVPAVPSPDEARVDRRVAINQGRPATVNIPPRGIPGARYRMPSPSRPAFSAPIFRVPGPSQAELMARQRVYGLATPSWFSTPPPVPRPTARVSVGTAYSLMAEAAAYNENPDEIDRVPLNQRPIMPTYQIEQVEDGDPLVNRWIDYQFDSVNPLPEVDDEEDEFEKEDELDETLNTRDPFYPFL